MKNSLIDLEIHFNSMVVDSHNDTMMKILDEETWLPKIDIGEVTENHIDIPKLKQGGIKVPFFAAYTEGYYDNTPKSLSRTLAMINALYWTENNNKESFEVAKGLKEIERIVNGKKIAAVPTIEGGYSFDENNTMELLRQYYDLGVRVIAFNWNYSNALGDGASMTYNDPDRTPSSGGLTKLGESLALEMNRLGVVIDVSHMSEDTFWGIINTSESPVIASHSGVYSLRQHPRNLKDEQLKALGKNGGVISIVLCQAFLTDRTPAYIKDFVDHIDYAVNLIGIDHVGIGSDFDGATIPEDIKDSSELYKITEELIKREYKDEDIEKLLGKNILRVLKEVEDNAVNRGDENVLDLNIIPNYDMEEKVLDSSPLLTAKIENLDVAKIHMVKARIIVDGISHKAVFHKENSSISLKITDPLKEKFHVVTFELVDADDSIQRVTRIFQVCGL